MMKKWRGPKNEHTSPWFKASTTWLRAKRELLIAPLSFNLKDSNKRQSHTLDEQNDFKKMMCHNIANLNHPDTITKILCKLDQVE